MIWKEEGQQHVMATRVLIFPVDISKMYSFTSPPNDQDYCTELILLLSRYIYNSWTSNLIQNFDNTLLTTISDVKTPEEAKNQQTISGHLRKIVVYIAWTPYFLLEDWRRKERREW